jgi:acetyl-CoA carboxylase biotin carboxyl carrier protein
LELKDIKAIIDLMKKNDLAVFKLEKEGFKLELEAHRAQPAASVVSMPSPLVYSAQAGIPAPSVPGVSGTHPSSSQTEAVTSEVLREIVSPMVGTFYRAPSPDSAPYIQLGQEVVAETVVCIIEAMKVMNEIKAEVKGKIAEILLENGTPVQFGQALFRVR